MLTAAVWLMGLLGSAQGWGLSPPADEHTHLDLPCDLCFLGRTAPRRQGSALGPGCHETPGGHGFATLRGPDCDTDVALAFCLGRGWTPGQGENLVAIEEDGAQVFIPALLRGGDHGSPSSGSALQRWDWLISTLIRSSIAPQCSALGGDLYVLTGVEGCQAGPLWSAACCSVPGGKGGFSVGVFSEMLDDLDGARRVSVEELQERLGVEELFSGGCQGADEGWAGVKLGSQTEEHAQELLEDLDSNHDARHSDFSDSKTKAEATEGPAMESESGSINEADETRSIERVVEHQVKADDNSSNIVVSILSTILSILKAPLRPIFFRITEFPGQVTYVLQEDLGVLAALPGNTFSLFYLLISDLLSWIRWAIETLLDVLMNCGYDLYYCVSSMLGELLNSCYTGVTGVGTLASDTLGIFGGALGKTWRASKFFGGRLLRQSGDYAGTVAMEMGDQAIAVGGGTGLLAWRSVSGVFNAFVTGGSIVIGVLDVVFGAFTEGFGRGSETTPIHTVLPETE